jgi:cation transport protein ChaC
MWIFAYGSLLWRPGFPVQQHRRVILQGFSRRLYQGSPDHRGTPVALGRVATLVPSQESCLGLAYRVATQDVEGVLAYLDEREQGGYIRQVLPVQTLGEEEWLNVFVYVANPANPYYLGPAPEEQIAEEIAVRRGPSGSNLEYLLRLDAALQEYGFSDPHISRIAALLRA